MNFVQPAGTHYFNQFLLDISKGVISENYILHNGNLDKQNLMHNFKKEKLWFRNSLICKYFTEITLTNYKHSNSLMLILNI